jgi:hypothetical protein
MSKLISPVEKMVKRMIKKGELTQLDNLIFNDLFDEVEKDMEEYRIIDNYRKGLSLIEPNKILIYQNSK